MFLLLFVFVFMQGNSNSNKNNSPSGATTPVRKISAQEFERGGLIKPMVTTIDGTPTFLSPPTSMDAKMGLTSRKSREELQVIPKVTFD